MPNKEWWSTWSEPLAYVVGFAFADGAVAPRRNRLVLAQSDPEILTAIQSAVPNPTALAYSTGAKCWRLTISDTPIEVLRSYALVPNKTALGWFPSVPAEFARHYVRGFFDGDGSISISSRGLNQRTPRLSFVAHLRSFLEGVATAITASGSCLGIVFQDGRNWRLAYSAAPDIRSIHKWMYDGATLFIHRKEVKMREAVDYGRISHFPKGQSHHMARIDSIQVKELRERRSKGESVRSLMARFRISETSVRDIVNGRTRKEG